MSTFKENIKNNGHASLSIDRELNNLIQKAYRNWFVFCSLPKEVKTLIPYIGDSHGVGYELKKTGHDSYIKQNFDISSRLNIQKILYEKIILGNTTVTNFVREALALGVAMESVIDNALEEFGMAGQSFTHFVRFLHYFPGRQLGYELAAPHLDKGGLTFHLYESTEGLQYLSFAGDESWVIMLPSNRLIIAPSMQAQYLSEGEYKAMCHKVVANETSVRCGRYSIICFVVFDKVPVYDKETHGPLNKFSIGFNYDMTHEDFSKLFTKKI